MLGYSSTGTIPYWPCRSASLLSTRWSDGHLLVSHGLLSTVPILTLLSYHNPQPSWWLPLTSESVFLCHTEFFIFVIPLFRFGQPAFDLAKGRL